MVAAAMGISRKHWLGIAAIVAVGLLVLLAMNRPLICTCGTIKLWEGTINGPGNSQHIADWYSFSHVIHGFIFAGIGALILKSRALGVRAIIATIIEMAWEIGENTPMMIDRYRAETIANGYSGDSVLNSIADTGWMLAGFLLAARLGWKRTLVVAIAFELFTLAAVRDNLTLNILMLVAPNDVVRNWQAGA